MNPPLTPDQCIQLQARQAAACYSDINAACPHPWGTHAAGVFRREFELERARIEAMFPDPDDLPEDPEEAHFCQCGNTPGIEELDWNKCDCCGKPINP